MIVAAVVAAVAAAAVAAVDDDDEDDDVDVAVAAAESPVARASHSPASDYTADRSVAAAPAWQPRVALASVPGVRDDCDDCCDDGDAGGDGGAGYPARPSAGLPEGPPLPRLLAPVAC